MYFNYKRIKYVFLVIIQLRSYNNYYTTRSYNNYYTTIIQLDILKIINITTSVQYKVLYTKQAQKKLKFLFYCFLQKQKNTK